MKTICVLLLCIFITPFALVADSVEWEASAFGPFLNPDYSTETEDGKQKYREHLALSHKKTPLESVRDNTNMSVLHLATVASAISTSTVIFTFWRTQRLDINMVGGNMSRTAAHFAAIWKRKDHLRVLIKLGAKLDIRDADGKTPLDYLEPDDARNFRIYAEPQSS